MAIKEILLYANNEAALRRKSMPVANVSRPVRRLVHDLKDTLADSSDGVGLAAPQIGDHKRVIVVRLGGGGGVAGEPDPPIALVNPVVLEAGEERRDFDGCLSFPGLYGETVRPHYLRVTGLDEQGRRFDCVFQGMDAVVVHHEIDHLDGVLFIDRIESLESLYRVRMDEHGQFVRVPALEMRIG